MAEPWEMNWASPNMNASTDAVSSGSTGGKEPWEMSWAAPVEKPAPKTTAGDAVQEGYLAGAGAGFRDEIYGASKASGLPDWLGGFRAPVGAARLALEKYQGEP